MPPARDVAVADSYSPARAVADRRSRVHRLDRCLTLLEDAMAAGREHVDGELAADVEAALGDAGLLPGHRLEGRQVRRVLKEVFELQTLECHEPAAGTAT